MNAIENVQSLSLASSFAMSSVYMIRINELPTPPYLRMCIPDHVMCIVKHVFNKLSRSIFSQKDLRVTCA